MSLFIKNIKKLVGVRQDAPLSPLKGKEMETLPCLDNAWLLTDGDRIKAFGTMDGTAPESLEVMEDNADDVLDASGRMVFPSYCDSHTHLVYAGSREMEFMDKLRGLSYQEIARRGGGILNSVELLHNTSEDDLLRQTLVRAWEIISLGTGAVEIKSGYGATARDMWMR